MNRREFLKAAGVAIGSFIVLGEIPEAHGTIRHIRTDIHGVDLPIHKGWVKIGMPFKCTEQPSSKLLREIEKRLKKRIHDDARADGFSRFSHWEFIVHPGGASSADPLDQIWSGGVKCWAKAPRGWDDSRSRTLSTVKADNGWKDIKSQFVFSSVR